MHNRLNKFSDQSLGKILLLKLFKLNWLVILCVILLGFVGVASLYSAAGGNWEPWAKNHLIRLIFGFFLMLILAFLPPKLFFKFSVTSFFLGIISFTFTYYSIKFLKPFLYKSFLDKPEARSSPILTEFSCRD